MQPTFNSWIGYFNLIYLVDEFIFLDVVQLQKRSWQTRNKFKINGKEHMFSIPIIKNKTRDETMLNEAKISYENYNFKSKLYSLITLNYRKAKFYEDLIKDIKEIIFFDTDLLIEYNINFIRKISNILTLNTQFELASNLKGIEGSKGDLIISIIKSKQVSTYISPIGSKNYLDNHLDNFKDINVTLEYQNFIHPEYKQLGKEFLPYMGILDLLLNEGVKNSKKIIINKEKV